MAAAAGAGAGASSGRRMGSRPEDDVVIVAAARTPVTKAKRGGLASVAPDQLLRVVLQEVVARAGIRASEVQDIVVGNTLQSGGGAVTARMAQLQAGIPHTTPLSTVNRQCSSGLQAIVTIAGAIAAGAIDIGIGAGA